LLGYQVASDKRSCLWVHNE